MQGSLSLPQRVSLQNLAAFRSYKTFGVRSVGFCSFPHWPAPEKLGANHGVANDSPLLTAKGLALVGNTNMRGTSFASTPSCSYKTEVTLSGFNRTLVASGKSCGSVQKSSCGFPKPIQRHAALQWLSIHTQREYATKPVVRVAGKSGAQEALVKEEEVQFKRIVSESDSITTFYSSDASSSSEDEEDEKETTAAKAYNESDSNGEKVKDHKKATKVKALQNNESKIEITEPGKCQDSETVREDDQEKSLMNKRDLFGKCEDSDSESEDEKEEMLTKEEKKIAKAELKLKEKLEKERMKALKNEEKKQNKEAKKPDCEGKKEESDSDNESDKKGGQNSREETQTLTEVKVDKELASDSEDEEEDDGVTDWGDDDLDTYDENLKVTEDEIEAYVEEIEISNETEEALVDIDEDDDIWDDDDGDVVAGDGGTGGGVVLGGTEWGTQALHLAKQVVVECGAGLSIFAFKVSSDRQITVRLDKLSDRYGSPTLKDIEKFSRKFSTALEESGEAGTMPKDIDVEVSSPGAERVLRLPADLDRFKELPMYVQYLEGETDQDGVFELDSVDMDAALSVWKIANVRLNREVTGRGRPLNSKQRKWRATIPFASLKQVRLYLDV